MSALHPIIIAGGSGTRFWPLSRRKLPKQLLPLTSDEPLLVETLNRLDGLAPPERVRVVCGKQHAAAVAKLLPIPRANVVVEPAARNTAPAIGLAALHVAAADPDGTMVVLPADHHIGRPAAFRKVIRAAARAARGGRLVTVGIRPTRPETGYGYLRVGDALGGGASEVRAFVEKPDLARARRHLKSGDYLWNGGIFVFRADALLAAIAAHLPDLSEGLATVAGALGTPRYARTLARVFPRLPSISIDYGVMERARGLAVVPGDFEWSDVGSFAALPEVRDVDANGNVASGEGAILVGCSDSVVLAGRRLVAAVGLERMIVVDAGDAILVVPRDDAQAVREAVKALEERGLTRYL